MIRFPKRPRSKSIDLEEGDLVELEAPSDPEELIDTGVVPPKARAERAEGAQGKSLAPVAMPAKRVQEDTFLIARIERRESPLSALLARAGTRPSLPWAAALLMLGAIGSAASTRLLDALDGRTHEPPASGDAVAPAAAPLAIAAPLPQPAKPAPVVLSFGAADTVKVAVEPPRPPAPVAPPAQAAAPAPAPTTGALPAPAFAASPAPNAVALATAGPLAAKKPAPAAPADSVKRSPQSLDALADQQLKAALK